MEEYYPNNDSLLIDISNIWITFNDNNEFLKNIPFCHINSTILNEKKRQERYVLFTSEVQLKKMKYLLKYLWMELFILNKKIIIS